MIDVSVTSDNQLNEAETLGGFNASKLSLMMPRKDTLPSRARHFLARRGAFFATSRLDFAGRINPTDVLLATLRSSIARSISAMSKVKWCGLAKSASWPISAIHPV